MTLIQYRPDACKNPRRFPLLLTTTRENTSFPGVACTFDDSKKPQYSHGSTSQRISGIHIKNSSMKPVSSISRRTGIMENVPPTKRTMAKRMIRSITNAAVLIQNPPYTFLTLSLTTVIMMCNSFSFVKIHFIPLSKKISYSHLPKL